MEVINDLLYYDNLKIIQNKEYCCFSLDAVLLATFVTLNKNIKRIIDFGTGNAPIPLIISTRIDNIPIQGIELQNEIYDLAIRSVELNHLEDRIEIINGNIKDIKNMFESDTFDVITCNPPFYKYDESSNISENDIKAIAWHEIELKMEDIMIAVRKVLKNNGVFAMVHRTDRLIDIITLMKKNNLEPKRIRLVYPKEGKESNIVLVEAKKNGLPGLKILPPLYIHKDNGEYTDEALALFRK